MISLPTADDRSKGRRHPTKSPYRRRRRGYDTSSSSSSLDGMPYERLSGVEAFSFGYKVEWPLTLVCSVFTFVSSVSLKIDCIYDTMHKTLSHQSTNTKYFDTHTGTLKTSHDQISNSVSTSFLLQTCGASTLSCVASDANHKGVGDSSCNGSFIFTSPTYDSFRTESSLLRLCGSTGTTLA